MSKGTRFLSRAAFALLLWLLALFHPGFDVPKEWDLVVAVLPLYAIVTFGAYSLASIGYSLYTFRDCPEAYDSLMKEVTQAKAALREKGLVVAG
ncbi:dolichol-phosphate mannosyltransferase subunit 3 [Hyaloraphidium curvatum]|nr:dolichol-phosphate mannosyltransferase subunit 3 [Hyaloraphidium curvatum]